MSGSTNGRWLTGCLVGLGLLAGPALAWSHDKTKGDNKDDARSGKIDAAGDGNSGQGDDQHKKEPGDKIAAKGSHNCDKDRCFDRADRAALEELKRRCGAILDRPEGGERDLGNLDTCVKRFVEAKKICPDLIKRLRQEMGEECKRRIAERKEPPKLPDHKCKGEKCNLCPEYKRRFQDIASRLREGERSMEANLREEAKRRCAEHLGEGDGCDRCGGIRREFHERMEQIRAEFQERIARLREEFKERCVRGGGPRPLPPLPATGLLLPGERGNNGLGNGVDPQPPGNPPVNDGAGTRPGRPALGGGTAGGRR